ncbi:hypothetical protein [Rhizobium sp. N122]|uniref:hypothetical protein n=1 Tax=Rhizobium sp. N122 TaxID=1764272 RepID=UPI001FD9997C|nr:hypothetical protein [Rhizobium sp. N122]
MAKTTRREIYTPEQIDVGVKHKLEKIDSFLSDLFSENSEEKLFLRNILGLMLKVYHMDANNKPMTKMQACRYLPFKNQTVCQSMSRQRICVGSSTSLGIKRTNGV